MQVPTEKIIVFKDSNRIWWRLRIIPELSENGNDIEYDWYLSLKESDHTAHTGIFTRHKSQALKFNDLVAEISAYMSRWVVYNVGWFIRNSNNSTEEVNNNVFE